MSMLMKNNKGDLVLRKTYASPTSVNQVAKKQHLQYTVQPLHDSHSRRRLRPAEL